MAAPGGVIVLDDEDGGGGFLELCGGLTSEHPEVLPFLAGRRRKAGAAFGASAELRNVLRRCLHRVRARPDKVYVYINELCTVLKAHAPRRKVPLVTVTTPPTPVVTETAPGEAAPVVQQPPPSGSKRQIRSLENLLRVYAGEIRRLQERELDLAELGSAESPYVQEGRLKRRLVRLFERLCALKRCSSLTGRVAEQRIAYRGTRYPEVNRRIERFINHRPAAFPDYADILKVIEKASARHGLALPRRRMESMAQEAFREVGNRLQERRHLDLVYNFGSHLTDHYRPGSDPALLDAELARRLRRNRALALTRLDGVIARYARLQEEAELGERARRRRPPRPPPGDEDEDDAREGTSSSAGQSRGDNDDDDGDGDDGDNDDDSEEDDEDEESSEAEEREEGGAATPPGGESLLGRLGPWIETLPLETPPSPGVPGATPEATAEATEATTAGATPTGATPTGATTAEGPPCSPEPSEAPAPPRPDGDVVGDVVGDVAGHKRKRPPGSPRPEDGAAGGAAGGTISSSSGDGRKRRRLLAPPGDSPPPPEALPRGGGSRPPGPLPDSTRADSPGLGLVSSSQGSPPRGAARPAPAKTSVATQCDPEEIIVLSD
ncbi:death domain-associated protein 6 [Eudromia elegans]